MMTEVTRQDERDDSLLKNNTQKEKYKGMTTLSTVTSCKVKHAAFYMQPLPFRSALKMENAT